MGTWFNLRLKFGFLLWVDKNIYRHWHDFFDFFRIFFLFLFSFFHCPGACQRLDIWRRIIYSKIPQVYTIKSLNEYNDLRRYCEVTLMLKRILPKMWYTSRNSSRHETVPRLGHLQCETTVTTSFRPTPRTTGILARIQNLANRYDIVGGNFAFGRKFWNPGGKFKWSWKNNILNLYNTLYGVRHSIVTKIINYQLPILHFTFTICLLFSIIFSK